MLCVNSGICYTPGIVIDWTNLLFNSFWIVGLAILVAVFSYHYWLAGFEGTGLKEQLNQPSFHRFYWISFTFTGIGLAGTSQRIWEAAVWILFTLLSVVNVIKLR